MKHTSVTTDHLQAYQRNHWQPQSTKSTSKHHQQQTRSNNKHKSKKQTTLGDAPPEKTG
jgi:hypothetical protein